MKGKPWAILSSPADVSLAHCVSSDFQMSTGVAREFKKKFESVKELKKQGTATISSYQFGIMIVVKLKLYSIYLLLLYFLQENQWAKLLSWREVKQVLSITW